MRALTRMRSLAAACALLLVVAGSAAAWVPGRPIDRGGSPTADPPMVGDPDSGQSMPVPLVVGGRVFLWRIPLWVVRVWITPVSRTPVASLRRAHK
jgi:hypothetical protein